MNLFKARCSKINDITAYLDKPELPVGAITVLNQWLKEARWKRRKQFKGKEVTKGLLQEDESIDMIMLALDTGFIKKNTERKTNSFLTGECDIDCERENIIIDAKNSWGLDQFPMYSQDVPTTDKKYIAQMQGYLHLWNRPKGYIAYCLMDCPTFMIKDAIQKELWQQQKQDPDIFDISYEDKIYIIHNMVFTRISYHQICRELKIDMQLKGFVEIPIERRVKAFEVNYDKIFMDKVEMRVRKMNELLENSVTYKDDYNYLLNQTKEKSNGVTG